MEISNHQDWVFNGSFWKQLIFVACFPKNSSHGGAGEKRKIIFLGVPAMEMKSYKYFLVEENRNHWAVRKEIPGGLVKNAECTEKLILFLDFMLAGFWGRCGKEFCWADGDLWQHWVKAFPLIYRCSSSSLDLFSFSWAIIWKCTGGVWIIIHLHSLRKRLLLENVLDQILFLQAQLPDPQKH